VVVVMFHSSQLGFVQCVKC